MPENIGVEEVIAHAAQSKILEVPVHVDLQDGHMMQVMALVDMGSYVSFIRQEVLEQLGPHLLQNLTPFKPRVQRISGEVIPVRGSLSLMCSIAGCIMVHEFMMAWIVKCKNRATGNGFPLPPKSCVGLLDW